MSAAVLAGYKLTEVGAIPQDWDYLPLDQLTDPSRPIGYGIVQTGKSVLNGVKCLRVVDIVKEGIDPENLITTTEEISKSYARTLLREGDLVIALRGKIGAVAVIDTVLSGANLTRGVALLSSSDAFHSHYLSQYLSSSSGKSAFERNLNGSALQEMPIASLRKMCAVVPPIAEQRAIAAALSDVDALLAKQGQLIAKKQGLKQAAMQQLLTGQTRLPGFSGNWEMKRLDAIADIRSGGTPSTTRPEFWDGGVLWCTPTDITALSGRKYLYETSRLITAEGLKCSSAELIPAGSIVMTSRATIGECAINSVPVTTNQGFKNFVPFSTTDGDFLYYLLQTKKQDFIGLCSGSTFLEIGKTQLIAFEVKIPATKAEQTAIAAILSDIDTEIAALEKRQTKTRALKQGMMQELLTGRTRLV
jgi:type I restriction enzyme, S subunit